MSTPLDPPCYDHEGPEAQECTDGYVYANEDDEDGVPCTFEGVVDTAWVGDTYYWTCPACGTEHKDEYEDPRDPHDMWLDSHYGL